MNAAMDHFIAIGGVSKRFGGTLAVDDVTLGIGRGEFFSLLGPSGCGKTTLLRMIGGFAFPDAGTIAIDGHDVTGLPPNKRPTNMVFQSYAIFPHLNVRDNIAYGLRTEGVSAAERDARVAQALAMIKLDDYGERRDVEPADFDADGRPGEAGGHSAWDQCRQSVVRQLV